MFAPTVTGSPMRNACRAIAQHEPHGRGYYAGAIALVGAEHGQRVLDSAILIRTADIAMDGSVRLTAGATIVRHSDPEGEAAETAAKAAGMLRAMTGGRRTDQVEAPMDGAVVQALHERNDGVSTFWRSAKAQRVADPELRGVRITVVDAEDDFSAMLAYQLRALGCAVRIQPWQQATVDGDEVLVLGPGPGAPDDPDSPKMAALRELATDALARRRPLIAVCLGHQIVCDLLGLPLSRLPQSNQGRRAKVGGRWLGFYNSYAADPDARITAHVTRDPDGHVLALTAPALATAQFHAESFLTEDSPPILRAMLRDALTSTDVRVHEHA
jgi:phenazine biosynthesis protein phzE